MEYVNCSTTNNGKYPIGCTVVGIAQATAYYRLPYNGYRGMNFDYMLSDVGIWPWEDDKCNIIANYFYDVYEGIYSTLSCDGSESSLKKSIDLLSNWGGRATIC